MNCFTVQLLRISLALLLFFMMSVSQWSFAAEINGVRLWRAPDKTRLVFDMSEGVQHKLFTLSSPDRVVIDLTNTKPTEKLNKIDLKDSLISGIRNGVKNKTDLRVVLAAEDPYTVKPIDLPSVSQGDVVAANQVQSVAAPEFDMPVNFSRSPVPPQSPAQPHHAPRVGAPRHDAPASAGARVGRPQTELTSWWSGKYAVGGVMPQGAAQPAGATFGGLKAPAVWRRESASDTVRALEKNGMETYDIPAFLRKQAD